MEECTKLEELRREVEQDELVEKAKEKQERGCSLTWRNEIRNSLIWEFKVGKILCDLCGRQTNIDCVCVVFLFR